MDGAYTLLPREEFVTSLSVDGGEPSKFAFVCEEHIAERVVRCSDCVFSEEGFWDSGALLCKRWVNKHGVDAGGFCSWGRRRNGE